MDCPHHRGYADPDPDDWFCDDDEKVVCNMTIGIVLLILQVVALIINIAALIDGEKPASQKGCLVTIFRLAIIVARIWFIIRFWNIPF